MYFVSNINNNNNKYENIDENTYATVKFGNKENKLKYSIDNFSMKMICINNNN